MQLCTVDIITGLLILRLIVAINNSFLGLINVMINVFIPQVCTGSYELTSSTVLISLIWFNIPTIPGQRPSLRMRYGKTLKFTIKILARILVR